MPSTTTYSSPKIAKALSERFGTSRPSFKVEMKYTREVGAFIKKVQAAHRCTNDSKLVFKQAVQEQFM